RDQRSSAGGKRPHGRRRLAARRAHHGGHEAHMRSPLPRLHAITDERTARRPDLDTVARALADGGSSNLALHARGRELTGLEHYDLSLRLSVLPSPLFVNDRLDVALSVPSFGVQLGHGKTERQIIMLESR